MRKVNLLLILGLLLGSYSFAQVIPGGGNVASGPSSSIVGNLQTATGGTIKNGTLSFTLSQPAVVSNTSSIAASTTSCYTSNQGNIVGVPDPLVAPVVSAGLPGTLAAGTYYVKIAYVGAGGVSVASPESVVTIDTVGGGALIINPPALQPPSATGFYNVYIGTTSGSETLQAVATGWVQAIQSGPLGNGAAAPTSNSSTCNIYFSDSLIPTGTFYTVGLVNRNGSQIAGFPQTWCTYGGAGGTINVSNGAPTGNCGTNGVFYPTPIFSNPQNGVVQSINGPVNFFGIVTFLAGVVNNVRAIAVSALNGVCYVDGYTNTTLAQAIACAGSSGTIEVPPSAGTLSVLTGQAVPAGVTLRVDRGATIAPAGGQVLTIAGSFEAGLYQAFSNATGNIGGVVNFTSPGAEAVVRPEWWGAKADGTTTYPVTGTDNLGALNAALASLPVYQGLPSQGPYTLANNQMARTGKVLLSPGRYVISNTLTISPFVTYECPSYVGCFIVLKDSVAAAGPEVWTINVQALTGPSPNTSYGAQFRNIGVDCNANLSAGGHNASASGVIMNGAQGTQLGSLWIENCGIRGFWLQNSGSNLSGLGGYSDLEVLGVNIRPGAQLDAAFANFGTIRVEQVNNTCSHTDADGDQNPGLLVGSAASNGAVNLNIDMLGAEFDCLPAKIWSGNAITFKNVTLGSLAGGSPTGIIISHGANAVSIGTIFTFASSPNLFTNFIVDRTTTPTTNIAGNSQNFPSILGYANNGTQTYTGLLAPLGNILSVATSDFTTANNTNFQTITGLSFVLPANQAQKVPFQCHLAYSQATGAVSDSFGVQAASLAPTNFFARGHMQTNATVFTEANLPTLTTTTATAVVTGTPSAITTIWNADLDGFIENPSGVANTINIMVSTTNGADAVTVKKDSWCKIW